MAAPGEAYLRGPPRTRLLRGSNIGATEMATEIGLSRGYALHDGKVGLTTRTGIGDCGCGGPSSRIASA